MLGCIAAGFKFKASCCHYCFASFRFENAQNNNKKKLFLYGNFLQNKKIKYSGIDNGLLWERLDCLDVVWGADFVGYVVLLNIYKMAIC